MSDAPERIWTASTEGKCHVGFDTPSMNYTNEYIRADLMEELVEALETAHECLLWCAREGRMASPSLSRYPERWADNLALKLTKIKGGV